ncbi:uncharacterized protein LOC108660066 [Drosophila navojoa]|uniref:uncharacterized protein LOC108660066 n=1 Tax=Drosophila navojoa TaxID=7232 RepID=UPI0008478670|nr:uncharacterized protein LOC108660066 [Drosophila navojoa]
MSSHWQQWVDRNAKPKNTFVAPSVRLPPTRWQKPGPMNREQWIHFYKWAKKNARPPPAHRAELAQRQMQAPTQIQQPKLSPFDPYSPLIYMYIASEMHANRQKEKSLQQHFETLSQPKHKRKKYVKPPKREYPYRPQLCNRPPPRPERGRPVAKPKVPCCFQHENLRLDFWSKIDYKISPNALRAKASKKVVELAKPRTYPPKPHCPLPAKPEEPVPKRTKMSARQWREHRIRLNSLSLPNPRVLEELSNRCNCPHFQCICKLCGCMMRTPR